MRVGEFLKYSRQQLVTCKPDDGVEAVAKLLHAHNIGAMPVCELGARMVGILSERDLVRMFATRAGDLQKMSVHDIMTKKVVTCGPEENMQAAQELMRKNWFRHLPVIEGERVVGILSIRDTLVTRLQESEFEVNILRDIVVAARHS